MAPQHLLVNDVLASLQSRQDSILQRILHLQIRANRFVSTLQSPSTTLTSSSSTPPEAASNGQEAQRLQTSSQSSSSLSEAEAVEHSSAENGKPLQTSNIQQQLSTFLQERGVTSFQFKRVPSDYYHRSYEERRDLLSAASISHLCKSIVMVNTQAHETVRDCSIRNNSKYYVIVVQYVARLHAEKVKKFIYSLNHGKIPKNKFNMRLAPESDSYALTGYEHNAVTPLNMRTNIPVILSEKIFNLEPSFIWLGGGEVDLKLGMKVQEFVELLDPYIVDCTYSDDVQ